jgi:putative membrane protein insertion efficiency factor
MKKIKITFREVIIAPFIFLIHLYRWIISPWLGQKCRFTPTCSQYAMDALRKYGIRAYGRPLKEYHVATPGGTAVMILPENVQQLWSS